MEHLIGKKVKFVNEQLSGSIIKVVGKSQFEIEADDGFDYVVDRSEVVVLDEGEIEYSVNYDEVQERVKISNDLAGESFLSKYIATTKYQYEKVLEIDLHLEELVEFPLKLDDWQRLHTQMQHVKKCLNAALNQRVRRMVFIHGVGQGVLKTELKNYLAQFDYLTFKDADYREYGSGATEVIIKNP